MNYPRIRKHLVVIPLKKSISIGSSNNTGIEIEDEDGLIRNIISYCDGRNDVRTITHLVRRKYTDVTIEEVEEIIKQISMVPYIMEDASNDKKIDGNSERHSRNLNFLSNFDPVGGEKFNYLNRIINSTVLVIGLGGAGTNMIYNLASFGVKNIIGVDFDTVEMSNLNRQILYKEKDIGFKKVVAAQKNINEFNSEINFIGIDKKIESSNDIIQLIDLHNCDFVFCAADKPSIWIHKWCNDACQYKKIPWSYTGMAEYVTRFQTIIPEHTSCFECYERSVNDYEEAREKFSQILTRNYGAENDCILANSSLAASILTFDIIKILAKINHSSILSVNKIVKIDHFTNEIKHENINRHFRCTFCGDYKHLDANKENNQPILEN
jgi:molybdopterin-synthase adenylyltransferase